MFLLIFYIYSDIIYIEIRKIYRKEEKFDLIENLVYN